MPSLLVFNRVYRLEIQTVLLVFSTGFVKHCPSNLLSGQLYPPSLPCVNTYTVQCTHVCVRGGGGSMGSQEGSGLQTDKHLCRQVPLLVSFREKPTFRAGVFIYIWSMVTGQKGTTNLTFFQKTKNTDPLMGAKLKSKTHLQNTFFDFLSRFLRVWLQSLKKVLI